MSDEEFKAKVCGTLERLDERTHSHGDQLEKIFRRLDSLKCQEHGEKIKLNRKIALGGGLIGSGGVMAFLKTLLGGG